MSTRKWDKRHQSKMFFEMGIIRIVGSGFGQLCKKKLPSGHGCVPWCLAIDNRRSPGHTTMPLGQLFFHDCPHRSNYCNITYIRGSIWLRRCRNNPDFIPYKIHAVDFKSEFYIISHSSTGDSWHHCISSKSPAGCATSPIL